VIRIRAVREFFMFMNERRHGRCTTAGPGTAI